MALSRPSRLMTVRLDPGIRLRLDELAAVSDRTLAQLIRYALTSYLDLPVPPPIIVSAATVDELPDSVTGHTAVRVPEALAQRLDAYSTAQGLSASEVIRQSLAFWLSNTNPQALGVPSPGEAGAA